MNEESELILEKKEEKSEEILQNSLPIELIYWIINIYKRDLKIRSIIDKEFAKKIEGTEMFYKQVWIEKGLNYQDASEWLDEGWNIEQYQIISYWVDFGFRPHEVKIWLSLCESEDSGLLLTHLRSEIFYLSIISDLEKDKLNKLLVKAKKWRKSKQSALDYINILYPKKIRNKVKSINLLMKNISIENNQKISINGQEWESLRSFSVYGFFNFKLNLKELSNLKIIKIVNEENSRKWHESNLDFFAQFPELRILNVYKHNLFGDISDLKNLKHLEFLCLQGNTRINGNISSLSELNKLIYLNIYSTSIKDEGLELLSDSLEIIYCNADRFPKLKEYKQKNNKNAYRYKEWKENFIKNIQIENILFI